MWANTAKGNIKKLWSIQNFAARILTGTRKYDYVTPASKLLILLPVTEQLCYRDIVLAYKCVKVAFLNIWRAMLSVNPTNFRQGVETHTQSPISEQQQAVSFWGVKLWNSLPKYLKCLESYDSFKSLWKSFTSDSLTVLNYVDCIYMCSNFYQKKM